MFQKRQQSQLHCVRYPLFIVVKQPWSYSLAFIHIVTYYSRYYGTEVTEWSLMCWCAVTHSLTHVTRLPRRLCNPGFLTCFIVAQHTRVNKMPKRVFTRN